MLMLQKAYYQYLLSFGILGGISSSLLFTPSVSAIGHWFRTRRALATGIGFTGGSMGGVIFPLVILYLAPKIGFPWAIRAIGLLSAGLLLTACLLVRTRLPLSTHAGTMIDIMALRDVKYGMTTLAIFFIEFAVFIPLTYISSYAIHAGIAPQKAYLMVAFLNAASILGRAVPGYFADRFGRFNVMACTSFVCSLFIFTLWLLGNKSEASITAFSIMFGFWSGTAIGLGPACIAQVCRIQDLGKRNGTAFAIASFGALIGIPIAGAILNQSGTDYFGLIMFGGALYVAGSVAFAVTRGIAGGWKLRVIF
jgi:MFS family permease